MTQFDNLYQLFIVDSVQCVIMCVMILLEVCLDVRVCVYVCQSGKTAVMVAARADYASIVDVIIKHEYLHILTRHRHQLAQVRYAIRLPHNSKFVCDTNNIKFVCCS